MKRFEKIVNDQKSLTSFTKRTIIDVRQGSEYTSEVENFKIVSKFLLKQNIQQILQ